MSVTLKEAIATLILLGLLFFFAISPSFVVKTVGLIILYPAFFFAAGAFIEWDKRR